MKQFMLTVAAGKRLIGKGMAQHPAVQSALGKGTIVIIAGTTNGCVADEIAAIQGTKKSYASKRFFRGVTLPPHYSTTSAGRLADESRFPGDVVIRNGQWEEGRTIDEIVSTLKEGDVIIKGANALDPVRKRAAVLIGNPEGGTIAAALHAVIGRRVRLIMPVGLEKRVYGDLDEIAAMLNAPGAGGSRLLPVPGEVFTEIEAIKLLSGAEAVLAAAGGVGGAEGCIWLAVNGTREQVERAGEILRDVSAEPGFVI